MSETPRAALVAASTLIIGSAMAVDPWGWAPFGPLKWTLISTTGFLLAALIFRQRSLHIHRWSSMVWAAFIGWGVVVGITALDPLYTWIGTPDRHMGLVTVALFAGAFFAGQAFDTRASIVTLLKAAVVALAVLGAYTLLEVANLAPVDTTTASGRPGGPYGTAAYLAAATTLLLPIATGAAVDGLGSQRWRYFSVVAIGLGGFAALAAQTRAGWVGLLVAGLIALPASWPSIRRNAALSGGVLVGLIVIALLSPIGGRLVAALDFDDGTTRGRLDEWQVGATVAVNHPVTGVGFEGYRIAFAEGADADYERRYGRSTMPDRAHNGALDVAATTGLPGLAIYLAAIGFLVWRARRAIGTRQPWLIGIAAAVAGYLAQQWFLFPLAEVDPVFWLFAGLLVAATAEGDPARWTPPRQAAILPAALAVVALVAGLLDIAADHRAAAAADNLVDNDIEAALQAAADATALRPDSIRYFFVAAATAAHQETAVGYGRAVGRLDQALDLSPGDPILRAEHASYLLRFAQASRDPASLTEATDEWESLVADDPVHARYRLELGNAYALAGLAAAAEAEWLAAADLAPTSTAPLTNLASLLIETGRLDEARAALDRAKQIDPTAPAIARLDDRLMP